MKSLDDAHGRLILDYFESGEGLEVVERDDGFIDASGYGPAAYFAPYRRWPKAERAAMRLVRGRMLDVGCGAGRVALELQEHGHDVVGIDVSPLALGSLGVVADGTSWEPARVTRASTFPSASSSAPARPEPQCQTRAQLCDAFVTEAARIVHNAASCAGPLGPTSVRHRDGTRAAAPV